jgi:phosphatidylserine/phosphatidylglycerophosphate/cardiolipin synthase-like enzyme
MDVLVVGGVMQRLRSIFDAYWNSHQAYPVETIVAASDDRVDLQQRTAQWNR